MSDGILILQYLYFDELEKVPECERCNKKYKLSKRFYSKTETKAGGYVINFASPEKGYREGDEVYVSRQGLEEYKITAGLDAALTKEQIAQVFRKIFDDPANPDVRIRWRRLRAFLTKRYQHPDPVEGEKPCLNLKEEKYQTQGPPQTIFQWAEPLFVALYALGFSPREIEAASLLELEIQQEVYQSVRRQINEYLDRVSEAEQEELETLHKENRRKYLCHWEVPRLSYGMRWEVSITSKQGEMDQRIVQWLKTLAAQAKDLEFVQRNTPIDNIERLAVQPQVRY
jgi:hypothetical protein